MLIHADYSNTFSIKSVQELKYIFKMQSGHTQQHNFSVVKLKVCIKATSLTILIKSTNSE